MVPSTHQMQSALAMALLGFSNAAPTPGGLVERAQSGYYSPSSSASYGPDCGYCNQYGGCVSVGINNTPQIEVDGTPWTTAILGQPGSTLILEETHTTGFEYTVGAGLGLGPVSFSGSYSYSSSNAQGEAYQDTCPTGDPENWQCALQVTPQLYQVSGFLARELPTAPFGIQCEWPHITWTAQTPIVDPAGNTAISVSVCICPNSDGSVPDGAPSNTTICAACA